ncbi:cadherin-like beta sandwich domain-containing protein [Paenibacillus sp. CAU 1782]
MDSKRKFRISTFLVALLLVWHIAPFGLAFGAGSTTSTTSTTGLGPLYEATSYSSWPDNHQMYYSMFAQGVYDGKGKVWMIPAETNQVVAADTVTGELTGYSSWPTGFTKGNGAFSGGVFDGQSVWMIPALADRLIKVDTDTGEMSGYNDWPAGVTFENAKFTGGVYDNEFIWLIPSSTSHVIRVNPATGDMTSYNNWPAGYTHGNYSFSGGAYDGESIWLIPSRADRVIRLNPETGEMEGFNDWPPGLQLASYKFNGGVYDGQSLWMLPYSSNQVVRLDTLTGEMTGYENWPEGFNKSTEILNKGDFDGRYVWSKPSSDGRLIRIDTENGVMEGIDFGNPGGSYSATFDGTDLWMVPSSSSQVIRISSVPVMNSPVAGDSEATLSWEPVNGASGYVLYQSETPDSQGVSIATVGASEHFSTVTGLTNGTAYYFSVKAVYPARESVLSNQVGATPQSSNAELGALTLSAGELDPVFSSGETRYSASVGHDITEISVTAQAIASDTTLVINGSQADSAASHGPIPLTVGENELSIIATAANGNTLTYSIVVTRAEAPSSGGTVWYPPLLPAPGIDLNGQFIPLSTIDATKPSATLRAQPNQGAIYANIPFVVLNELEEINKDFYLELQAPFGGYRIPAGLASLLPELPKALEEAKLGKKDLTFRFTLVDKSSDDAIREALEEVFPGGKRLGSALEYRIDLVNSRTGMVLQTVNQISAESSKLLYMPLEAAQKTSYWGVFRYDAQKDGTNSVYYGLDFNGFAFAPAVLQHHDNQITAFIDAAPGSIYLAVQNENDFVDINGHWGASYIKLGAAKGLVNGVGGDYYSPNRTVTNSEFALMLARAFGVDPASISVGEAGKPLARQEMAAMLAKVIPAGSLAGASHESGVNPDDFRDMDEVEQAYEEAVRSMAIYGIMTGTGADRYQPQGLTTRAQAATVLIRGLAMLGKLEIPIQ